MKFWKYIIYGLVAQLVRAPPCHGGGHGFESRLGRLWWVFIHNCMTIKSDEFHLTLTTSNAWDLSSAGRASALQAEGHRFKSCRSHLFFVNIKYGGIAQLARARGSYPRCRWFKSSSRYFLLQFFVCNGRQTQTRKGYYVKMLRITALKLLDRNLSLI